MDENSKSEKKEEHHYLFQNLNRFATINQNPEPNLKKGKYMHYCIDPNIYTGTLISN